MAFEVRLSEEAADDMVRIWIYVATTSGSARADDLDSRLQAACGKLAHFPRRGSPRDELGPGLRSVAFQRRATIIYRVCELAVEVTRILYAGQDPKREFGAS
jgi:toxin ParE1/3/4